MFRPDPSAIMSLWRVSRSAWQPIEQLPSTLHRASAFASPYTTKARSKKASSSSSSSSDAATSKGDELVAQTQRVPASTAAGLDEAQLNTPRTTSGHQPDVVPQAPNRSTPWVRNQMPREEVFRGARFEQTDLSLQVKPSLFLTVASPNAVCSD